jgi:nucleoside-diphosphate-sugar epimerase
LIADIAGKNIELRHVAGPVGVKARNFRIDRMASIGWKSRFPLRDGISRTYPWILNQVENHKRIRASSDVAETVQCAV